MRWQDFDYEKWQEEDAKFDHKKFDEKWNEVSESSNDLMVVLDKWNEVRKNENLSDPPLKPNAYYNKVGDILEITLSDDDHYAKWLCPSVHVLLSFETNEVVGVQIWGVKNILKKENCSLSIDSDTELS